MAKMAKIKVSVGEGAPKKGGLGGAKDLEAPSCIRQCLRQSDTETHLLPARSLWSIQGE